MFDICRAVCPPRPECRQGRRPRCVQGALTFGSRLPLRTAGAGTACGVWGSTADSKRIGEIADSESSSATVDVPRAQQPSAVSARTHTAFNGKESLSVPGAAQCGVVERHQHTRNEAAMTIVSRRWVLRARPAGRLTADCFAIRHDELSEPSAGEVLVRVRWVAHRSGTAQPAP